MSTQIKPLSKVVVSAGLDAIDPNQLETFSSACRISDREVDTREQMIVIETDEFTAVCPFSGLPDIGKLSVRYCPGSGLCVELRSFKYYLLSYRLVGIYQEHATALIFDHLKKLLGLKADQIEVSLIYNIRGGILTTCTLGEVQR